MLTAHISRQRCSNAAAKIPLLRDSAWAVWRARRPSSSYDWSAVVRGAAERINTQLRYRRRMEPPFFSVVIPTYNRKDHLLRALDALSRADLPRLRSRGRRPERSAARRFPKNYQPSWRFVACTQSSADLRSPVTRASREAHRAHRRLHRRRLHSRSRLAGEGRAALRRAPLAGLEGRIRSDKLGDPKWRTVSNIDFEGIGFMTANMFYRRDLLQTVGGFDERFHDFREDTDLAWRVMEFGDIPHARDVVVFHPPHPATVERESQVGARQDVSSRPVCCWSAIHDKYISTAAHGSAIIATSRASGITLRADCVNPT